MTHAPQPRQAPPPATSRPRVEVRRRVSPAPSARERVQAPRPPSRDRVLVATLTAAALLSALAALQWSARPEPRPVDLQPLHDAATLAARQELGVRVLGSSVTSLETGSAEVLVLADGSSAPTGQVRVRLAREGATWSETSVEAVP